MAIFLGDCSRTTYADSAITMETTNYDVDCDLRRNLQVGRGIVCIIYMYAM